MKKTAVCIILATLLTMVPLCFADDPGVLAIEDLSQISDERFTCCFDGVKHDFVLILPEESSGAPLVLMLPGYGNTAETFRTQTYFDTAATALGYAVAYVSGAPDPTMPTSSIGWNYEANPNGNRDCEFLSALALYLQETYTLDPNRCYAVGFSNGAFMIHRLATEAGDLFSAFVSVAGTMPATLWNARPEKADISFFQITGEKDDVVPKQSNGSAQYSIFPAIEDVMAYWAEACSLEAMETEEIASSLLTKHYSAETPQQVWHLLVQNGRHSWPTERFTGIDANAQILLFFEALNTGS